MKIEKAIEQLQDLDTTLSKSGPYYRQGALKLGIEALKLIQRERLLGINPAETLLPGETED